MSEEKQWVAPAKPALKPSKAEYQRLFDSMQINSAHKADIDAAIARIDLGRDQYTTVVKTVNPKCPWYAVGIAHYMEANCNFTKHIHNGDSLIFRTVNEPANRPLLGQPPFTWIDSCVDWMKLKGWSRWQDWKAVDILARLELNNGLGYRNRGVYTPYLWSFTSYYTAGKYITDKRFDKNAISQQVGAAILLKAFY